jgi:proteic killer suppression protein
MYGMRAHREHRRDAQIIIRSAHVDNPVDRVKPRQNSFAIDRYIVRNAYYAMIRSFADKATERLFRDGICPPKWRVIEVVALRKLDIVDSVTRLADLRSPPGNRLEALKGDRSGQYSIRINQQWRVCFRWTAEGPEAVEIVDYH